MYEIFFTEKQNSFGKIIKCYESDQLNALADRLDTDQIDEVILYLNCLKNGFEYSKEITQ